jgi:hypothetical protein
MGRLPRLNGSKNGYIEGPKFPHLVDRQREKFSLYPFNQIRVRQDYLIKNLQLTQITHLIMTARSSTASSDAMPDSSSVNLITQNHQHSDSESSRFGSEISIDVETFICNDIDLEKADRHILNKDTRYRLDQYAALNVENYEL